MSLAKCPQCGKNCSDMAAFCPSCDFSLNSEAAEQRIKANRRNPFVLLLGGKSRLFLITGLILLVVSFPAGFAVGEYSRKQYRWDGFYNDAGAQCGWHKITGEYRCGYENTGILIWGILFIGGLGCIITASLIPPKSLTPPAE